MAKTVIALGLSAILLCNHLANGIVVVSVDASQDNPVLEKSQTTLTVSADTSKELLRSARGSASDFNWTGSAKENLRVVEYLLGT